MTQGTPSNFGAFCWRNEHAGKFSVIVDAADYFSVLRRVLLEARHSVLLIGWDIDVRVELDHDPDDEAPAQLGRLLTWIAKKNPDMDIRVLQWSVAAALSVSRISTPLFILNWLTRKNVRYALDTSHPVGAAHHQKIVVVDDVIAFCGGIDILADRWDTRQHRDDDPRRVGPTSGRQHGPWHDVTAAVDGDAARALGDLARARWKNATGEEVTAVREAEPIWPEDLEPDFEDIDVGIARTQPLHGDQPEIREIENVYLSAIECAEHAVYIESQYFASHRIADAIARRLSEPDGPEFVIINPESAEGWLEEKVTGCARAKLLDKVKQADRHNRFAIYTPVTAEGTDIYVHAKILIADDWLLRLGSSNLTNRSLGFDTECDLCIDLRNGTTGKDAKRSTVVGLRDGLLAEHLGCTPEEFAETYRRQGTLITAIEALRGPGRSLHPFHPPELGTFEKELADTEFLNPETTKPTRRSRLSEFLRSLRR